MRLLFPLRQKTRSLLYSCGAEGPVASPAYSTGVTQTHPISQSEDGDPVRVLAKWCVAKTCLAAVAASVGARYLFSFYSREMSGITLALPLSLLSSTKQQISNLEML